MTNGEAINWIINISADIGKAEHRDLWHYEQALSEIRDMLESAQPEVIRCGECKCWRELPNGCQGFCDMHSTYPTLTDFCSWAERREDNK